MFHSLLSGYSRFPVHEAGNPLAFVGLLLIKKVGLYDDTGSLFNRHYNSSSPTTRAKPCLFRPFLWVSCLKPFL